MEKLLEKTHESSYWIGFLMADGSFSKQRDRIQCGLNPLDEHHLNKLACFLDSKPPKRYTTSNGFAVTHIAKRSKYLVPIIMELYDIKTNKTKNPPNVSILNEMSDELFISWFIGLVDGDGSIYVTHKNTGQSSIEVGLDFSWLEVLESVKIRLESIYKGGSIPNIKQRKDKIVRIRINNLDVIRGLKIHTKLVPALDRKWNNVDENYFNERDISNKIKTEGVLMFKSGVGKHELAKYFNVSERTIRDNFKRAGFDWREKL